MKKILLIAVFACLLFSCSKEEGCIHGYSDNQGNVLEMGLFITGSENVARIINNTCKNEEMEGWVIVNGNNSHRLHSKTLKAGALEKVEVSFVIDDSSPLHVEKDDKIITKQF